MSRLMAFVEDLCQFCIMCILRTNQSVDWNEWHSFRPIVFKNT